MMNAAIVYMAIVVISWAKVICRQGMPQTGARIRAPTASMITMVSRIAMNTVLIVLFKSSNRFLPEKMRLMPEAGLSLSRDGFIASKARRPPTMATLAPIPTMMVSTMTGIRMLTTIRTTRSRLYFTASENSIV